MVQQVLCTEHSRIDSLHYVSWNLTVKGHIKYSYNCTVKTK